MAHRTAIFKSAQDSTRAVHEPLEVILQNLLLDVVTILAVVEIATIVVGYLRDAHVHIMGSACSVPDTARARSKQGASGHWLPLRLLK